MQRETTTATWLPPGSSAPVPWVTPNEFADAVAVGNALPGPIAPQVSAYVGYRMAGFPGAVAAAVGTVLPTTLLMLAMIVYFFRIKDAPGIQSMLKAVRPVVVGLLLWTAWDMGSSVFGFGKLGFSGAMTAGWDKALLMVAALLILTGTKINPAFVIAGAALIGRVIYR